MVLLLLACLGPARQPPGLDWLAGSWHDPEHQSTRLVFTRPCEHGVTGVLSEDGDTTVLAIQPDGRLSLRHLGSNLSRNSPTQEFNLLSQRPLELRYEHISFHYVSGRNEGSELLLQRDGQNLRLRPD